MTDLFIPNRYASLSNSRNVPESGVRAYRHSPVDVHLQIRIKGKQLGRIASLNLPLEEARQLANHILAEAEGR